MGIDAFTTGLIADRLVAGSSGIPAPREPWQTRSLAHRALNDRAVTANVRRAWERERSWDG
jgi:hypothetical protein